LHAAQSGEDGFSSLVTPSLRIYKSFQLLPAIIDAVKKIELGLSRSSRNSCYKSVEERVYEVGDRVMVFDLEVTVAKGRKLSVPWLGPYVIVEKVTDINYILKGRKLRVPWLGPYVIVEKVTDINYILKAEGNGAIARSHVNRLPKLRERLVEPQEGV
jgi:hypothetical protein